MSNESQRCYGDWNLMFMRFDFDQCTMSADLKNLNNIIISFHFAGSYHLLFIVFIRIKIIISNDHFPCSKCFYRNNKKVSPSSQLK